MYQDIFIERTMGRAKVHLWDDKRGYYSFPYKNYAYIKDPNGDLVSLYGDKVRKVARWEEDDLKAGKVFESDVPMETRILIDTYGESDEPSEGVSSLFFDIEVEVTDGFPEPLIAENKITAIALYDSITEQHTALVLDPENKVKSSDEYIVEKFQSEEELLQRFYQKYLEINPNIITGWNSDKFDIPYLYNRTIRVLGQHIADTLSPIGKVMYKEHQGRYKIAGRSCLDYLTLYKNFTFSEKSSYRLDFIGEVEVGMKKVEYEGTLNDLYRNDIDKFVEYNVRDVKIVVALDEKLKMIELVRGISHMCHIPYEEIYFTSRYLEGAILTHLRKLDIVAPNKPERKEKRDDEEMFTGAYVKDPQQGRHEWIFDLDVTSMYPSIIMSLNISPETKLCKVNGWNAEEFLQGKMKTYSLMVDGKEKQKISQDELKNMLSSGNVSISSNGVMYRTDKKGLMPVLLDTWFSDRVEYRKLAKKYAEEGDNEKHEYFNRRQYIQKVILNSLYGVLGLPVFRFYDVDNAEATTITGQDFIKFSEKMSNFYYNKELGTKDVDYCIYIDTDSLFFSSTPIVKERHPQVDTTDEELMSKYTIEMSYEIQEFLNTNYDKFAKKFLNLDEHRFNIKQEVVAKSGVWLAKKRYGQWIIRDAGVEVSKLEVKGLDIIRSNFPEAFRDFMRQFLKDILDNKSKDSIDTSVLDFKKNLEQLEIHTIALPTGVKKLSKYIQDNGVSVFGGQGGFTSPIKGTPVHVKSAIAYNDMLKHFNLHKRYEGITNGSKIKWVYLKPNPFNLNTIAFKGFDDPKEILDWIETYIDRDRIFQGALEKKINLFYEAMEWSQPVDKQNTLERFF